MRPLTPRLLAPLPPRRQPRWYTVMRSKRSRHPGSLRRQAALTPAMPPPRIAIFGLPPIGRQYGLGRGAATVDRTVAYRRSDARVAGRRGAVELAVRGHRTAPRPRSPALCVQHRDALSSAGDVLRGFRRRESLVVGARRRRRH